MKKIEESELELNELEEKYTRTLNQYIKFLSGGVVQSKLLFHLAQHIKSQMKSGDIISKFNQRNADLIDILIRDLLERISFEKVCSSQEASKVSKYITPKT